MSERRREFASNSKGDRWYLSLDGSDTPLVVHVANRLSGGAVTKLHVRSFLDDKVGSPEYRALLRLIGSLVDQQAAGA